MSPRKVRKGREKGKRNDAQLFLKYYGSKDDLSVFKAENVAAFLRKILFLNGFISDETLVTGQQGSNLRKIAICTCVGTAFLQWIFLIVTMVSVTKQEVHSITSLLPFVMIGALLMLKAVLFCAWKKHIQTLISELVRLWNHQLKLGMDDAVITNAKTVIRLMKLMAAIFTLGTTVFILRPLYPTLAYFINGRQGILVDFSEKVLPTQYFFPIDNLPVYILCNLWEAYSTVYVSVIWFVTDMSIFLVGTVIALKLQILGLDFRNIVKPNDVPGRDDRLIKRLCKVAQKHANLLTYCRTFGRLFSPLILAVVVYSALFLSVSMITCMEEWSKHNTAGVLSYAFTALSVVQQAAVYCEIAQTISDKSANIAQELYDCDWTSRSIKFKKLMIMIMMRSQNNYVFKVYGFYVVNRTRLAKIIILTYNMVTAISAVKAAAYG